MAQAVPVVVDDRTRAMERSTPDADAPFRPDAFVRGVVVFGRLLLLLLVAAPALLALVALGPWVGATLAASPLLVLLATRPPPETGGPLTRLTSELTRAAARVLLVILGTALVVLVLALLAFAPLFAAP